MLPDFPEPKRDVQKLIFHFVQSRIIHHLGFWGQVPRVVITSAGGCGERCRGSPHRLPLHDNWSTYNVVQERFRSRAGTAPNARKMRWEKTGRCGTTMPWSGRKTQLRA